MVQPKLLTPPPIPELVLEIKDLYSRYTGLQIAEAIKEYRREQEQAEKKRILEQQIAELTQELQSK